MSEKRDGLTRRRFLTAVSAGAAAWKVQSASASPLVATGWRADGKPALLGGEPIRSEPFPSWPVIGEKDRSLWGEVLEGGRWNRPGGGYAVRFERSWAEKLGARYGLATSSGTSALHTCMDALEVGPGDEVIVPPYTFVATVNVVLYRHALPIFVDSDRETFQIDALKIEPALTSKTRCLLPVHLGGNVADMDRILEVGRRRGLPVVEDACQSHFAEWRNRRVGSLGDLGCFSFQASKNLNSGEGGAVLSNDGDLMALCVSYHNVGRPYTVDGEGKVVVDREAAFGYARSGDNRRITEFQGALLLAQLERLEQQARVREENAAYLTRLLEEIPGIHPARSYEGCTRNAYHLYMLRYDPEAFAGLPRSRFLEALRAEGVPASGGYGPLNRDHFLKVTFESRAFRKVYTERELKEAWERSHCPENDRLCEEAVWLSQSVLLAERRAMDQIAEAVRRVRLHASELA